MKSHPSAWLAILLLVSLSANLNAGGEKPQFVNLTTGETLHLAVYGGPHLDLIVNGVDTSNVTITTYDFEKMVTTPYRNPATGYMKDVTVPTKFNGQITKGTGASNSFDHADTLLVTREHIKVYYIDDLSTPQNAVKIVIVRD